MRVRVCVRVRPLLPHQQARGDKSTLLQVEPACVHLAQTKGGHASYAVDGASAAVLGDEQSQEGFYRLCEIDNLVDAVTKGFHATVFAYGQTGSGKTFTMEGFEYLPAANGKAPQVDIEGTPPTRLGIVPRAVRQLFARVDAENAKGGSKVRVMCSYVQIYKEQVLDLLNPATSTGPNGAPRGLKLRWSAAREFYCENLFIEEANDANHALSLFESGVQHKRMAETRMNAASSRSHCMFTLSVQVEDPADAASYTQEGRLTLVDLAGSERQSALLDAQSKSAIQDSVEINKSLFTLRKVILALSEGKGGVGHVPYRDSTLTRLLKRSLGGSCHTLMIACLSPADVHVDENHSTLAYATRARAITNVPIVNLDPRAVKMRALQQEVATLKTEIARLIQIIQLGGANIPPEVLAQLSALAEGGNVGGVKMPVESSVAAASAGAASNPRSQSSCSPDAKTIPTADQGRAMPSREQVAAATMQALASAPRHGRADAGSSGSAAGSGGAVSIAVQQALELSRQLAATNGKLRKAFDALEEQHEETTRAHAALMEENVTLRERLSLAELTLAMESYPTALPDSLLAVVQTKLRQAALEVVQLRAENAALRDQAAANPLAMPASSECNAHPPARDVYAGLYSNGTSGGNNFSKRPSAMDRGTRGSSTRRPSRGMTTPSTREEQLLLPPEPVGPSRSVLSSTGVFNLAALSAFDVPPPPTPGSALVPPPPSLEELVGSSTPQWIGAPTRTMPRLVQPASTFKELDELSALLRKKAALKAERPNTASVAGGASR
mmetsp:Transcript_16196/g.49208  ORF Transcript_16196/g.49208 Transcript_16196/m.49208 type:complete len:785 (-) Transcript_16196:291-2645(-)